MFRTGRPRIPEVSSDTIRIEFEPLRVVMSRHSERVFSKCELEDDCCQQGLTFKDLDTTTLNLLRIL